MCREVLVPNRDPRMRLTGRETCATRRQVRLLHGPDCIFYPGPALVWCLGAPDGGLRAEEPGCPLTPWRALPLPAPELGHLKRAANTVRLPGVSDRRPLAFPIETAPKAPVFVYSPLKGEWVIAVRARGIWFDRVTGEELLRPTHWIPLPELQS